jgi:CubicO group peptidase (beta-lactamase class C family)
MRMFDRIAREWRLRLNAKTAEPVHRGRYSTAWMRIAGAVAMASAALIPATAQTPDLAPPKPLMPEQSAPVSTSGQAAPVPQAGQAGAALTKTDVDAWLDGFMPYALQSGDIAGGVVVVVKDGQVLTQRGFGYAEVKTRQKVDPANTMFRPGSISKLFTWTAVMQLVQSGKLDLDQDINTYLDFRIPPKFGKPITLRNLMTHTPGFEETVKYLILYDPAKLAPLKKVLDRWVPERIYAPGAMPAYSNYGAALAGYIVQRVSGEPFDDYVQHHIFAPLGMTSSSFAQPLPPALAGRMAKGYMLASQPPGRFELVSVGPAGSLSTTGADIARFMIAHLSDGGALLDPQTARLMHAPANRPIPGLPAMALGFYHEDRNGLDIIGHGGDTVMFHSDLHLYLGKDVGLFISLNSAGKQGAAHILRERLFAQFTDRYFPAPPSAPLPTAKTAHAHGAALEGHYISSRRSDSNFVRIAALLGQSVVSLNSDDTLTVSSLTNAAGAPKRWREVAPWHWVEVGGGDRLGAVMRDGHVAYFSTAQLAPIMEFIPAPTGLDAGWVVPVLLIALFVMALTAIGWPVVALVRRRYNSALPLSRRDLWLHRSLRITAWLMLIITIGWFTIVAMMGSHLEMLDGRLDGWMWLLQILGVLAIIGTGLSLWNAYAVFVNTERRWVATAWAIVAALAAVFLVWLAFDLRLITFSMNF